MVSTSSKPSDATRKMRETKFLLRHTDAGGTVYVDQVPVKEGDPATLATVRKFYKGIEDGRRFEWQYRTAMAFREMPNYHCYWLTLTYRPADLPQTWEEARKQVSLWIKRVKEYNRRVLPKAYGKEAKKAQYIIVEEEAPRTRRKHFHVLLWLPYFIDPGDGPRRRSAFHLEKMLLWHYGFVDVKKVQAEQGLAIYIAKYAKKNNGRVKCSTKFGWMTITTLLSVAPFRMLVVLNPQMAQKLLRRLSLTPNYPTFHRMTSWISSASALITSREINEVLSLSPIGGLNSLQQLTNAETVNKGYLGGCSDLYDRAALRIYCKTLVRATVAFLRSSGQLPQVFKQHNPALTIPAERVVAWLFPGITSFGRPRQVSKPTYFAPDQNPRLWFTRHHHRACASRRAKISGSKISPTWISPFDTAENNLIYASDKPLLSGVRRG